jgi:hypothetical protein
MGKRGAAAVDLHVPGGYKQKLQAARVDDRSTHCHSKLAALLISTWSWGLMSAPMVQQIAHAAVQDGADVDELKMVSKLGTSGKWHGNCHRDLVTRLTPQPLTAIVSNITVYIMRSALSIQKCSQSILLPHEMFSSIYHHHRDVFLERILGGTVDNLGKFWDAMKDHPALGGHPVVGRPNFQTRGIPMSLHGDGVPVSKSSRSGSNTVDIYSWNSMIGKGPTLMTNYLIYLIYNNLAYEADCEKKTSTISSRKNCAGACIGCSWVCGLRGMRTTIR